MNVGLIIRMKEEAMMKSVVVLILLGLSTSIYAEDREKYETCARVGQLYGIATQMKSMGASPQEVLVSAKDVTRISEKRKKDIINHVYFDRDMAGASPQEINSTAFHVCMGDIKTHEPLK
jgi:hypothetical protein